MRSRLGWALTVLGALVAIAGLAVMLVLGPDGRFSTGSHGVDTDGVAVVTAPKVISWTGLQVDILAEVPVQKPVFVGVGNSVDVQDYLGKTRRLEVTDFHVPWTVKTREVEGRPNLPGAPTALDWWLVESAGLGGASISTTLPDQSVSAVVLAVGSTNLSGLQVTFAYGIKGGFYKGLALLLLGLALAWIGLLIRRGSETGPDEDPIGDEIVEEVVYVYVDEDGVEHELSAEEAEGFEVVEDEPVEVLAAPAPTASSADPDEVVAPNTTGVMTAAEFVAQPSTPVPSSPPSKDDDRVVYVFVDEDGVEHEVNADELAEWEVVDEEDQT